MIIFQGDATTAYRDPACFFFHGQYHLFFTLSIKKDGYLFNHIAMSRSSDLSHWTTPSILTQTDNRTNYSSPGSIFQYGDRYYLCITSYPMPYPCSEHEAADDTARLYLMETADFETFSSPQRIFPKGKTCSFQEEGRMIDPFILQDPKNPEQYLLFFKQNGISLSVSRNLSDWEYHGATSGGENACILYRNDAYLLIHSPKNGIGIRESRDLVHWEDQGTILLDFNQHDWATGRLTAGFAMEAQGGTNMRYILFYHASRQESVPETHGSATLAMAFTNDFKSFVYE